MLTRILLGLAFIIPIPMIAMLSDDRDTRVTVITMYSIIVVMFALCLSAHYFN